MAVSEPPLTVGVEEEYLLVDRATRALAKEPPAAMLEECEARIAGLVKPEFLRAQIEVATRVRQTIGEVRDDLVWLRSTVAEVADKHGLAPIAASTHPFSEWQDLTHTDKERYHTLARDMQAVARRLVICGMHVHVGVDDDRTAHRPDEPGHLLPPAPPGAEHVVAVLAGREYGPEVVPAQRLRRSAAHRTAGALRVLQRSTCATSRC